ncbi:MAG TPA: phytanoyl-CoA dioxygenase family protein [Caulobacteraceae bacterium]
MAQTHHEIAYRVALSAAQRTEFAERGLLRLAGLIPTEPIDRAREVVLARLSQRGLWQDGAWRLDALPRPQYPATGLKTGRAIGHGHPELAALTRAPDLLAMVDQLLDGHPFDRRFWYSHPQVLFTLPNADVWRLPRGWHTDGICMASNAIPGVQMFGFLDPVGPGGGGTLVVAGSHRLVNEGRPMRIREITRRLKREPFFRELMAGRCSADGAFPKARVGEVLVEVLELTGEPGDVWLTDMRLLHSGAPNAADRPRMMLTCRFVRVDALREIAKAYGKPWLAEDSDAGAAQAEP